MIGGEETDFTYGELQAEMDLIFPGDTNHHGTLFGGTALAHVGEIADITGRIVRAGTQSLTVEAELVADVLHTGERRLAAEEGFTMVAVDD